jgi:hypothetical protein
MSVAVYCGILYAFVCTFPGGYNALEAGLDSSWMYGLSDLAGSGYLFGRDVAFTYGPLGFLVNPLGGGWRLTAGVACWALLHVVLFGAIAANLRRLRWKLACFCAGYILLIGLGLWREYRVLAAVIALVMLSLEDGAWQPAAGAAVLSVFALEMKWSTGLAAIAVTAGSWLVLFRGSAGDRRAALSGIGGFAASITAAMFFLHRSPEYFWDWMRSSTEIGSGYSAAMSLEGPNGPLALAALSALVLTALFLMVQPPVRARLLLCAVPAFIAFKHGFVRQGGQSMAFFSAACLFPLIVSAAPSASVRDTKRLLAGFGVLFAIAVIYGANYVSYPAVTWNGFERLLTLRTGAENVYGVLHLQQLRESLRGGGKTLAKDVLPAEWQARLREASVSIVPWELSIGAVNPIHMRPIATLQLYVAYTTYLDNLTAGAFAQRGADYLIVSHEGLDGRNPFLDTPATWRAIMSNYELADSDIPGRRALLIRKPPRAEQLRKAAGGFARLGEWIEVPATSRLLYGGLKLDYSAWGKLARTFYHMPEARIELHRKSGRDEKYRLLTETAANGALLNYPPANQEELEDLLQGYAPDPVTRFRITAPGRYFRSGFAWTMEESSRGVGQRRVDPRPPELVSVTAKQNGPREATFEVTVSDPNGVRDLQFVQLIVNRNLNGAAACYLSYDAPATRLWLLANSGTGAAGVGPLGGSERLINEQCQVAMDQVFVHEAGNSLSLRIPVVFARSFSGTMHVYAEVIDKAGMHPGFQDRAELVLK